MGHHKKKKKNRTLLIVNGNAGDDNAALLAAVESIPRAPGGDLFMDLTVSVLTDETDPDQLLADARETLDAAGFSDVAIGIEP